MNGSKSLCMLRGMSSRDILTTRGKIHLASQEFFGSTDLGL